MRLDRNFAAGSLAAAMLALFSHGAALAADAQPHWGYHGEDSAEKWGELDKSFAACKLGKEQSPIDIKTKDVKKTVPGKIEFSYAPSKLAIVNNGHTVQVNYDPGSFIKYDGRQYELVQFHFHTPSEEEIDGKEFDLVAHLVHKSADGKLAVVAVLFNRGEDNAFLKTFWDKLPKGSGESRLLPKTSIKLNDLLPKEKTYYTFNGSLTTPPCSEGVTWFVLKNPVTLSKNQLAAFRGVYPMNNRPVQPLNGRLISEGG
ncbi:carbonic anhydrase [Chitinimonas sp.]|uniref:carbonic anhydrase n=1 Tax=Chitinimonas sp. TaxID=1934313 RepID=UPI0035B04265